MRLYDGDVPLIFGDLPEIDGSAAPGLMVQMMSSIAEFERWRIGERTKEALKREYAQPGFVPFQQGTSDLIPGSAASRQPLPLAPSACAEGKAACGIHCWLGRSRSHLGCARPVVLRSRFRIMLTILALSGSHAS
jgi:hypothetical protein